MGSIELLLDDPRLDLGPGCGSGSPAPRGVRVNGDNTDDIADELKKRWRQDVVAGEMREGKMEDGGEW